MAATLDVHGAPKKVLMLVSNPAVSPQTGQQQYSGAAAARLVVEALGR